MFRNYLMTAWRHIIKNRMFSIINILGLAIGFMSCIMILLFVRDELTYDSWVPEGDRVVRLHSAFYSPGRPPFLTVRSAGRMMEAVQNYASAEVEAGVRLVRNNTSILSGDRAFDETVTFADGSFFDVFDLPLVAGTKESAFNKPMDFVISEDMAIKYFGRTDVVGETLTACCMEGNRVEAQVTGVFRNIPENSHMSLDLLLFMHPSMFANAPNILDTWNSVNTYTYFKLRPGVTAEDLKERIWYWVDNESPFVQQLQNNGMSGKPTDVVKLNVMPLHDLHLYARKDAGNMGDLNPMGDAQAVYAFAIVAILILVIASINFMNLSTARGIRRAREVALRKVLGASRLQVAGQFLGEAVAVAILALLVALVGVELFLPLYNDAIDRALEFNLLTDLPFFATLIVAAVVVGMLSGSYPAAYLSRFRPARILKANKSTDVGGAGKFRTVLVVFQFAISIGLIVCTAVIYAQTLYARNMDVGYTYKDKVELLGMGRDGLGENGEAIAEAIRKLPGVESVVFSSEAPSQDNENNGGFTLLAGADAGTSGNSVILNYHSMGYDFFKAYDITPLAGRTFDRAYGKDEISVIPEEENRTGTATAIINETAMRSLGLTSPTDAVGRVLRSSLFRTGQYDLEIIGVVPDIYFRSLKFGVRPTIYLNNPANFNVATVTFATNDVSGLLNQIENVWQQRAPMVPLRRQFLNDMIEAQYQSEDAQATMFAAFSVLAVVVACLGLYGLASFTAEQRTKEIGIRKVLGARVRDIVQLLVWQFSRPVLIANIIAWPVAWYVMSGWLEGFQYRLGGGYIWAMALVAGVLALLVSWATVASRAIRVAQTNPIRALRYE
ncbi:ABC transporter permease [Kordiimonas gwangyangensis]|uniref:ABC transporter permease n=1 Tax=Kordiimonas gwangyangensis TaxID=288022 RepID=UPI0003A5A630|nr:ABC transporter permease [Kordiimonas gwangyangensis]